MTETQTDKNFFETDRSADACRPLTFPQEVGTVAKPLVISKYPNGTNVDEAILGAQWLGLDLFKQGLEIAGVMSALDPQGFPLYETFVTQMPRRSTKTTAVLATLLGRCMTRPNYKVASIAQTGVKSRSKLMEVQAALRAKGWDQLDKQNRMVAGMGNTAISFPNGSQWTALPPKPESFRQEAYDVVLIDEAGELDLEKADALLAGILPTMDTRPHAQLIVAGTPNTEARAGILWDTLQDLYKGLPHVGGVVYAAKDTDTFADLSDPDNPVYDMELLRRVHPGIGTLTTEAKVFSRLGPMGLDKWCAEYLCQWPRNAGSSALDIDTWNDCLSPDGLPVRPEKIGIAFDVDPSGESGAVVSAWRDDANRVHFEVLAAFGGTEWIPQICHPASKKYKGQIGYDSIGQNIDVADKMQRAPYRTPLQPLTMKALIGAAARIEKEIKKGNVVHYGQPDLTDAVDGATWRPAGTDGRLFARKASSNSVCTLVAASIALWIYDQRAGRSTGRRVFASTASR